jgi:hypothetical protein
VVGKGGTPRSCRHLAMLLRSVTTPVVLHRQSITAAGVIYFDSDYAAMYPPSNFSTYC